MSLSSIFSNVGSAIDPLSQIYAPTSVTSTKGVTPTTDADGDSDGSSAVSSAATSTTVSSGATLLKELQDLQKSNPDEFKKVTADIAAQLQAAAQQAGGSQGQALASIASKFQQASQTGDLSSLQTPHHHHGGHHRSSTAGSTTSIVSTAIAAYQQASDQSNPLTSAASSQSTTSATDLRSQVSTIIGQVLTQDLGSASSSASV